MTNTKEPKDWRSLPRKPVEEKRTHILCNRLTDAELAAFKRNAAKAGMSGSDYLVSRCCG